jgi:hypothetical protein
MMYTDGKGIKREIFLPSGKVERAMELLMKEDWTGLETEFEIYCQLKGLRFTLFVTSVLYMCIC